MRQITDQHLASLPVFPLPRVVFFPDTSLPLHVFEHRYRAMIQWCIDHEWPFAVPRIAPGHEEDQLGSPPLAEMAGVGHITTTQMLPDGRFNILLEGISRVVLLEEHAADQPWRRWSAAVVEDPVLDHDLVAIQMRTARQCLAQLRGRVPALRALLEGPQLSTDDPRVLSNRLCSLLFHAPDQRQHLLEIPDVAARLEHVTARLGRLLIGSMTEGEPVQ